MVFTAFEPRIFIEISNRRFSGPNVGAVINTIEEGLFNIRSKGFRPLGNGNFDHKFRFYKRGGLFFMPCPRGEIFTCYGFLLGHIPIFFSRLFKLPTANV